MAFGTMSVGASGVKAYSDEMQVISNNLANISTVGFKGSRTVFRDLMSTEINTGAASTEPTVTGFFNQIGKGVAVADIQVQHSQGAIEPGSKTTDMAVNGKGFFGVHDPSEDVMLYTRDGNMRFDKDGYLTNSHGYRLMGMKMDPDTGSITDTATDIKLNVEQETNAWGQTVNVVKNDPKATSSLDIISNLDSKAADRTSDDDDPFFALFKKWNGNSTAPLAGTSYGHSTTIKVYDSEGGAHNLSVYFDKVATSGAGGNTYWEYMVASAPSEDGRAATKGTSAAGVFMIGTMTFNGFGDMVGQSAYTLDGGGGEVKNLSNWSASTFSSGQPAFTASFTTSGGGVSDPQTIGLDFGVHSQSGAWSESGATAAQVGSNAGALPNLDQLGRDAMTSTGFAGAMATLNQSQDGYGVGYLNNVEIDGDGILTANYSNGVSEDLYQIGLFCFKNNFGLRREGGNMFRATPQSGEAILGSPNDFKPGGGVGDKYGFGLIQANALETSNVDMAEQFSRMIVNQHALQANTKVVSTSDELYKTALGLKR
ncbi:MAG: flagellar hook protein FlgE [Desulfovibrionaceae bacterium]